MRRKVKEYLERYLVAEMISTLLSMFSAWIVMVSTDDRLLSAYAGSVMASVAFYLYIAFQDVRKSVKEHKEAEERYKATSFLKVLRNLIVEFGPAELIDLLVVRPFFMYLIPKLMSDFIIGTFIGKLIADVLFYLPAIIMYEIRKKHLN